MALFEFILYLKSKERTGVCEVLNTCSPPHMKLVIERQTSLGRIITCSSN